MNKNLNSAAAGLYHKNDCFCQVFFLTIAEEFDRLGQFGRYIPCSSRMSNFLVDLFGFLETNLLDP